MSDEDAHRKVRELEAEVERLRAEEKRADRFMENARDNIEMYRQRAEAAKAEAESLRALLAAKQGDFRLTCEAWAKDRAEVESLRAVLAIGEALASTCDLDPATPHCCISLIAAHDLALALASVPEPSEGVFRAPTSFPESEVTPIAAAEGARDNFKQLWVQSTRVAERAEGRLRAVEAKAREWAALAPADDWGESMDKTVLADAGRMMLAVLESEPAPVEMEPVLADERSRPKRCPRCGEDCVYDGWDWTHASGYGVGSCPMEGE